jgi:hypothetical protein
MRTSSSLVLLMTVLTAVPETRGPQRAADNPFLPLVPVGQSLDGAFARFLAGQPAGESYPPFREPAGEAAASMRAALQRDRVTRIRSVSTEFELVFRREKRDLLYLRMGVTLDSRQSALVSVDPRPLGAGQTLSVTATPLTRYVRAGEPFARAAAAFMALASTGNCAAVPWADRVELTRGLPEDLRKDLETGLSSGARDLPSICASINRLDPDETYLRLDDVAHLAVTAEGRATGVIRSQFVLTPSGDLTLVVGQYRPLPKS